MAADITTDAVVVGAGHNGLVAACYLALAGQRVLVAERREVVGGATVTEEIHPGFRVSTASYSLSLLRPDIHRDLRLAAYGLELVPKDPQLFVPLPDGRHFFVWRDRARTMEELRRIHPPDADAYPRWAAFWAHAVRVLRPLVESEDPPPTREVAALLDGRGEGEVWRLAVANSAAETVESFFQAPEVQAAFGSQGIIGTWAGVRDPGTAWVAAYHALGGEILGSDGTWAYVRGGMGALSAALAAAARDRGAEIRSGWEVEEVLVEGGRATGVRLHDGTVVRARAVLSNADPKTTFLRLVPEGVLDAGHLEAVRTWKTPGCVLKVNLALSELPDFACLPGPGPQHRGTIGIAPSLDHLQAAFEEAREGSPSSEPFMEVFVASSVDETLAPPGAHVLSAFTQYVPPDPPDPGAVREEATRNVLRALESYAPNLPAAVLACESLGPRELEERFGLWGGNIFHGEILPEQSFGNRFAYRTPLEGLYLCGSGASPGGGVMGAAGRNAARTLLADLRGDA